MRSAGKKTVLRGVVISTLGVLGVLACSYLGVRETQALTLPIDLRPGVTRSEPFGADYAARYEVGLQVDRKLPFETTRCLLGEVGPDQGQGDRSCDQPSPLALTWEVFHGPVRVAHGGTAPGQSGAYGSDITRQIGDAALEPREDYVIEVTSHQDASALAPANPRVVLEVHPSVWKDEMVIRSLIIIPLLLIVVWGLWTQAVGAVWWTAHFLHSQRKSRSLRS